MPAPAQKTVRIDIPYCNRKIAWASAFSVMWLLAALINHNHSSAIASGLFSIGRGIDAYLWFKKRQTVLRDGPIEAVIGTGGASLPQTVGIVAGVLLTAVTVAFTVMTVAIVAMVLTSAGRFSLGIAAIVLFIDALAWLATFCWWNTLLRDRKQAHLLASTASTAAINIPSEAIDTETSPVSAPRHWWTETGTRDEVRQKIEQ